MAIDAIGNTGLSPSSGLFGGGSTANIQDQFMQILLTQLRYQDPMDPLKEQDFLAQLAQFSSATQISDLNKTVGSTLEWLVTSQANQSLLSAANLIGNTFMAEANGTLVEGVVESVCFDSGRIMVRSGDELIPIESLVFIGGRADRQSEGQVETDAGQGS